MHADAAHPSLVLALALVAGVLAQSIAHHLRVPGIVFLLGVGVLLGPDGLGLIQTGDLGESLHDIVGFAVAVILFEGGLNLSWRRIRSQAGTIQALITVGALITALGGSLSVHWIMGWDWSVAILFGTLVMVTGPTVITPLLRRIRVHRRLETILETEGVLVDALGAVIAVVALEIVIGNGGGTVAGLVGAPARLVVGTLMGSAGGAALVLLLRVRRLVPEGYKNILTLSGVLAVYEGSNALMSESGIVAAIAAGVVMGNVRMHGMRELREFKEQLTLLLLGLLFVLLAADVRLAEMRALGWPGVGVVAMLMLVVRPLSVLFSTARASLSGREIAFLAWIAPRGIVAAAIASLFGQRLAGSDMVGGEELRPLVFAVIVGTVFVQGLSAGRVARLLHLRRPSNQGYVILGADPLARLLGRLLHEGGEPIVLIESDAAAYREAEEEDYRVLYGNGLDERMLRSADVESRRAVVSALPSGSTSLLFVSKARQESKAPHAFVAIQREDGGIDKDMVIEAGATVLFGGPEDLVLWSVRLRRKMASVEWWAFEGSPETETDESKTNPTPVPREMRNSVLALVHRRKDRSEPLDEHYTPQLGDRVAWLIFDDRRAEAENWLRAQGWGYCEKCEVSGDEAQEEVST